MGNGMSATNVGELLAAVRQIDSLRAENTALRAVLRDFMQQQPPDYSPKCGCIHCEEWKQLEDRARALLAEGKD
jgi:hypothetical protein